ncbi:MAG: FAD binding domain-containing protein [Burkholderiales bacterium]
MKPAQFDYLRAASVEEALSHLATYGDRARIMAGGQTLMPMLNFRLVEPELIIDIASIITLAHIRVDANWVEIGAAVTQSELLAWSDLHRDIPLVAAALPWVGHFQTRNRGTVCGSIAHSDPSSELPLALAVQGGQVELSSQRGTRTLSAAEFQVGMLTTGRAPDELITCVRFPRARAGEGCAFREVARRHGDFAIVSLAALATKDDVALGVGGVAGVPTVRKFGALTEHALDAALNAFAWEMGGHDDVHATARYRRDLVRMLGRQVIEEARACRS